MFNMKKHLVLYYSLISIFIAIFFAFLITFFFFQANLSRERIANLLKDFAKEQNITLKINTYCVCDYSNRDNVI
jgi:hypothetical protein